MSEVPYRRQLSAFGAAVMALFLGALLMASVLPLWAAVLLFSPLVLCITSAMTAKALLLYPSRRSIRLDEPACLFLGAWAVAVPLAALTAPLADLLVRHAPQLLKWGTFPAGAATTSRLAVVAAAQLLIAVTATVPAYVRTPAESRFEGELPRKGPAIFVVAFGATFFALGVTFSSIHASALFLDFFTHQATSLLRGLLLGFGSLSAAPALLVGLACLRRGLWLREIQALIDVHPRATVRSAATGLVELHGAARPLEPAAADEPILLIRDFTAPGAKRRVGDFLLDDGTGTVRVRVPENATPGKDGTIDLVRRSTPEGLQPEFALHAGDPVYVLGEFVPSEDGGEIRPWMPPYGHFGVPLAKELFRQEWSFWGVDYAELLDLKMEATVFAVTDAGEERLRRLVRRRWARSLLLGFLLIAGAGAYLIRLWAA